MSTEPGKEAIDVFWQTALSELDMQGGQLLRQSQYDRGRRTYLKSNRVHKIVCNQIEQSQTTRANSLEEEFSILQKLQGMDGVPRNPRYYCKPSAQCLSYDYIEGRILSEARLSFAQQLFVLARLAAIVMRLSMRGVVHNDLLARNVVLSVGGGVTLIDFDQAVEIARVRAWLANFMKVTFGMKKPHGAFPTVAKQLVRDKLPERLVERLSHAKRSLKYSLGANRNPRLPSSAPLKLHKLLEAWSIARKSDASAPGVPVCYYEIVENGYRFPGERSWAERWAALRTITNYKGKRVLELGCNLSLLSCFLLKDEGAQDAMCVDVDSRILAAAQLISDAYEVAPQYRRVNFDSSGDWESQLLAFKPDVVTALSVLNWVEDKERFLRFLSNFSEVIFEGHDPFEIEKARFLKFGFGGIRQVAISERDRPVMLCTK